MNSFEDTRIDLKITAGNRYQSKKYIYCLLLAFHPHLRYEPPELLESRIPFWMLLIEVRGWNKGPFTPEVHCRMSSLPQAPREGRGKDTDAEGLSYSRTHLEET